MIQDRQRDFPVFREGVLVGILFRDDLLEAVRRGAGYVRVEEAMRSQFPTLSPDEPLLGAQQLMAGSGLKALPVLILGGLTSVPGAIIGDLIIGVGEKVAEIYWGPAIGGAIENWFAYVLALGFLLFRPQGLFGERIIERV